MISWVFSFFVLCSLFTYLIKRRIDEMLDSKTEPLTLEEKAAAKALN